MFDVEGYLQGEISKEEMSGEELMDSLDSGDGSNDEMIKVFPIIEEDWFSIRTEGSKPAVFSYFGKSDSDIFGPGFFGSLVSWGIMSDGDGSIVIRVEGRDDVASDVEGEEAVKRFGTAKNKSTPRVIEKCLLPY